MIYLPSAMPTNISAFKATDTPKGLFNSLHLCEWSHLMILSTDLEVKVNFYSIKKKKKKNIYIYIYIYILPHVHQGTVLKLSFEWPHFMPSSM